VGVIGRGDAVAAPAIAERLPFIRIRVAAISAWWLGIS
jgi:hypothetical protein